MMEMTPRQSRAVAQRLSSLEPSKAGVLAEKFGMGTLDPLDVFPDIRDSVDDMPPPPAIVQQAPSALSGWERELYGNQQPAPARPKNTGRDPNLDWKPGMKSSFDPESFPTEQFMPNVTLEERAALTYNAGFRGNDLVTMIAISMAEETPGDPWSMGPYSAADNTGENEGKWQRAFGLYQTRPLTNPNDPKWADSDSWRDMTRLLDPAYQAEAAMKEFRQKKGFDGWEAFTNGAYKQYLDDARSVVRRLGLS